MKRLLLEQVWPIAVVCLFFSAVVAAAMILAGSAKADSVDDYAAINAGRVCAVLDDFPSVAGVTGVLQGVMNDSGFGAYDAGRVVGIAVIGWCPRHMPEIRRFIAVNLPGQTVIA